MGLFILVIKPTEAPTEPPTPPPPPTIPPARDGMCLLDVFTCLWHVYKTSESAGC